MSFDFGIAAAGLAVGFVVGLTGMGGGALMTPMLILLFRVPPLAAVSSDLVASLVMKPVGGGVHYRRGTVRTDLVKWLVLGSVPTAFAGAAFVGTIGASHIDAFLRQALGVALVLTATTMLVRPLIERYRNRHDTESAATAPASAPAIRPLATLAIGALGGLIVGITSVGAGSLIIALLVLLYPTLRVAELVGTDLVQAIPLVASAALGHLLFGDVRAAVTVSLLAGALPGVYMGARISSRAPDYIVRPVLVLVLAGTGLKLI